MTDLGWVTLDPNITTESNPPVLEPVPPTIMGSPVLIQNSDYRWNYNSVRYLKMGYVLERNGSYESGEIDILSKAIFIGLIDPSTYVPAPLYFLRTVIQQTDGSLGVDFSVETDSLSISEPQFGLAYQITNASPAVYPTLRVFVINSLEG